MTDNLLQLLPKPIQALLEKNQLVDFVIQEAGSYGFTGEETAPCLLAAYYVFESTDFPGDVPEEWRYRMVFLAACRSAFKLLSYGKYKAQRTENGWMKYNK